MRPRTGMAVAAMLTLGTGLAVVAATQASAATGCRVAYTVNQWSGGFTGNVAVTNLGDPLNGWRLEWIFANGQTVTQGWNGVFSQSGSRVTVTNESHNGGLGTNATVTPGFNGTWTGTNSTPSSFTLNGVVCTGSANPGPTTGPPSPTPTGGVPAPTSCVPGGPYGNPLPSASVAAARVPGRFNFLEGPLWIADQGRLLVSDMQAATGPEGVQPSVIRTLTPPNLFGVFVANSGSNGLALSADGTRVLAATHDQRSLSSYSLADASRDVVAQTFQGRRFNSPNDVTVRADGTVYFTDPNFQRGNRADEMAGKTGVFRVSGDEVFLVDDTISQPNGVVLSPDGNTLYVGGNSANKIYRYEVLADGSTGPRTEFASVNGPDGATVDCAGNLYWASYSDGRVHVFAPDGRKLGTVSAGRNTTNAAFGGADGRTLFITSGTWGDFGVYQIPLNVPGWPY